VTKLSLSRAWDETREVARRDGKLIAAVALAMFFLPGVVLGLVDPQAGAFPQTTSAGLLMLVVALIGLVGQLAVIRMALGVRMTVGEAIAHGARRAPSYLIAGLIWAGPLILAAILVGGDVWRSPQTATGGEAAGALAILLVLMFVGIRMTMTSPVATAEQAGPLAIVRRSWQLTSGHWWRLFALVFLFLLVMAIVMGALGAVLGILTRILFEQIEPMSVAALLVAAATQLVSAIFTTGLLIMLARVYAQLAGPAHADVSVPSSGT
jgi:hypothetical protein